MPTSSRDSRLLGLFDLYSTNLQFYARGLEDKFVCPLCLGIFDKAAIHAGLLTMEHIIPSSLGGTAITMTCKACNNRSGSQLEAHLTRNLRMNASLSGESGEPVRGKLFAGRGWQTADFFFSSNSIEIHGLPEQSNPSSHALLMQDFNEEPKSLRFELFRGYNPVNARVAKIRIAYLTIFDHLGYGYILNENLDQIRRLIANPDSAAPALSALIDFTDSSAPSGVGVVKEPVELRSFISIIDLPTTPTTRYGMLFPGFDVSGRLIYRSIGERPSHGSLQESLNLFLFSDCADKLTDREYAGASYRTWDRMVRSNDRS